MAFTFRILAAELDGMRFGSASADDLGVDFSRAMSSLGPSGEALWVAFISRSRFGAMRRLLPFADSGRMPDYLILRHWLIYRRTRIGYLPCVAWNVRILWRIIRNPFMARRILDAWYEDTVKRFATMKTMIRTDNHLRMRFDSMADADAALAPLEKLLSPYRYASVVRTDREVEIRPEPFIKGLALSQLCEQLQIVAKDVLAIVYWSSDLSLVRKSVAACCGCAANADHGILHAVHAAGGHVARSKGMKGVLEVIQAYRGDRVLSDLPSNWNVPKKDISMPERLLRNSQRRRRIQRVFTLTVGLYVILAVFASFDVIPMSALILAPCRILAAGVGRLFGLW